MLYLTHKYGLKSNNFFQHVHLDAFCREHQIKFINLFLEEYYSDYPNLIVYKRHSKFKRLLLLSWFKIGRLLALIKVMKFDDSSQMDLYRSFVLSSKTKTQYCRGWYFRNPEYLKKYRHLYQHLFSPQINNKTEIRQKYLTTSQSNGVNIALHIRRGDYAEFLHGRYYFSDETYIDKIKQLIALLQKDCRIIIFTNDRELNKAIYHQNFNDLIISDNAAKIDHYLMSQCNYIMGPPSTFSGWASYIGNAPLFFIETNNDKIELEKFSVFNGYD